MERLLTFNELRRIKDALPDGAIRWIAMRLDISEDTVRNYFGGQHFSSGEMTGIHSQQGGMDGGYIILPDTEILDLAIDLIAKKQRGI